jgi:hypothetical protein
MRRTKHFIVMLLCVLLSAPATLAQNPQAQTVQVNCCAKGPGSVSKAEPYKELSKAIDSAPPGSTLVLEPGTYIEGRPVTKNITIKSTWARILHHTSTQKLYQLTGQIDLERPKPELPERFEPTASLTKTNFKLKGTDLGAAVEHNGRIYFLFGDTIFFDEEQKGPIPCREYNPSEPRPFSGDSIAWVPADSDPETPLKLSFISKEGAYISPKVRKPDGTFILLGGYEVPTSGFSVNGKMYVFFTTDAWKNGRPLGCQEGTPTIGRSVLARLDNEAENLFTYLYDVSCLPLPGIVCSQPAVGNFINIAPVVVNSNDFPELPERRGQGVLMWASADYRNSPSTYLAYVSADRVDCRSCWWYAKTDSTGRLLGWTRNESARLS